MAYTGYVNKEVQAMYGIPLSQLSPKQRKILKEDGKRRKKLIDEVQKDFMYNNKKAYQDEAQYEKVLAGLYRECQRKILADVTETVAKVTEAGGEWSYANQSALTRSKGLFEQINAEITKLGQAEATQLRDYLSDIYTDQFYRTLFTLGQVQTLKGSFNMLNPRLIQSTLNYPWSGAMFSDRIWLDKERLGKNLRWGLTQSMILGEGIPEMTKRINNGIETAKYNAERIARTETKRVTYSSQAQAFAEQGIKEVKYMTAGNGSESNICKVCSSYHGQIFELGKEPTLPIHPNCRCWYVPVVKDTFEDNELNELTGSVRGAENYENWRKQNEDKLNPKGDIPGNTMPKPKGNEISPKASVNDVFDADLGKEIRKSFDDRSLDTPPLWDDYKERYLTELYEQRKRLTDPKQIKQVDAIIKNHEEAKDLILHPEGKLVEWGKRGEYKLKVPPSEHYDERIRNSEYYNRYALVQTSYPKYNFDIYEERLEGKYYISFTGVSSKKERDAILAITDDVFTKNPRAIGAKLRIDTLECKKRSSRGGITLGFYEPSRHRLTVRNFKSYAEIYGISASEAQEKFAGTVAHEFAHIVHNTDDRLSKVVANATQWGEWEKLIEPYYQQYRVGKIVDFNKEWHRMHYPVNAEDFYRMGGGKKHYYQEMWAECTAIVQEHVSKGTKQKEVANLKKYFPDVYEFITAFYAGEM